MAHIYHVQCPKCRQQKLLIRYLANVEKNGEVGEGFIVTCHYCGHQWKWTKAEWHAMDAEGKKSERRMP